MPYTADHKRQTRQRIVESARVLFNRRGFEQVSIDDLMQHAGLTRGGFYRHFESKDELYAEAVASFSSCNPFAKKMRLERTGRRSPREIARMLVRLYLSDEVLDDPDNHCPLYALPSDVARAGLEPRAAYTQIIENMRRIFRAAMPPGDPRGDRNALLVVNLCVGGMVLARTTTDASLQRSLRAAARSQALALLSGEEQS